MIRALVLRNERFGRRAPRRAPANPGDRRRLCRARGGSLRQSDQSVPSPADGCKPHTGSEVARARHLRRAACGRRGPVPTLCQGWSRARAGTKTAPPVEPRCRRERIDSGTRRAGRMLPQIRERVNERVPDLPRRAQGTPVPPLRLAPPRAARDAPGARQALRTRGCSHTSARRRGSPNVAGLTPEPRRPSRRVRQVALARAATPRAAARRVLCHVPSRSPVAVAACRVTPLVAAARAVAGFSAVGEREGFLRVEVGSGGRSVWLCGLLVLVRHFCAGRSHCYFRDVALEACPRQWPSSSRFRPSANP